ncbi:MAG: CNNM domain-containing protein, partial [Candidatus Binatia bacterium]
MPGCIRAMSFIFSSFALWLAVSPVDRWDSPGVIISKLLVIAALVALNGFFVAAEFALVKVRHSQVHALTLEGNKR